MAETFRIILSAFGIGLVIFVHELGHYIAARMCGVRVVTFSLGFGPKLLGWRKGGTLYQIAMVPFGGYCRMAGDEMPDMTLANEARAQEGSAPSADSSKPLGPRSDSGLLSSKSVGQRFFIYSGGVLMNVAFALVVFPILFHVGVPFIRPIFGTPQPGGPAWQAGLSEGTEVLEVNGTEVFDFLHVQTEVALCDREGLDMLVREPGATNTRLVHLVPRHNEDWGIQVIEVLEPLRRDADGLPYLDPVPGSAAERAGLRSGDRLVEVVGAPRGLDLRGSMRAALRNSKVLELLVRNEDGDRRITIHPDVAETKSPPRVGIMPLTNHVAGLRTNAVLRELGLRQEDRILTVQNTPLIRTGDLNEILGASRAPLVMRVERDGAELELHGPVLTVEEAVDLTARIALLPDLESTRIQVTPNEPAYRAGLRDGDHIVRVDGTEVERWSDVPDLVKRAASEDRQASFTVSRTSGDGPTLMVLAAQPEAQPILIHGANVLPDEYVYRTQGVSEAVRVGALCSWQFLEHSWLTLKRMAQRQVSVDNMGGIIAIGAISYTLAESGWEKLFFFLCMLSINLAFLNVLPIPVLDGGHLFFLIIEKIKGSPVSARVFGYSQMVGVILILFLMVFVTYNDFVKWVLRAG